MKGFSIKAWLLFALLVFVGLWIGGFVSDIIHATGNWAFLVRFLVSGAVVYLGWERWLRKMVKG